MRAGMMRETIVFEERVGRATPTGFVRKAWEAVLTCKARKRRNTTAGDGMNASEEFIETTVTFQTYRYPIITNSMRVRWAGDTYGITLLDPQDDNTYYITCKKNNE